MNAGLGTRSLKFSSEEDTSMISAHSVDFSFCFSDRLSILDMSTTGMSSKSSFSLSFMMIGFFAAGEE